MQFFGKILLVIPFYYSEANSNANNSESFQKCITAICEASFASDHTLVYIHVSQNPNKTFLLLTQLIPVLSQHWSLLLQDFSYDAAESYSPVAFRLEKARNYIIQFRDFEEFSSELTSLKSLASFNPHGNFLVVSATIFEQPFRVAVSILRALFSANILRGIVLLSNSSEWDEFNAYTWFPYKHGNCGSDFKKIFTVAKCRNGAILANTSTEWFARKMPKKFHGCKMNVRLVHFPPFTFKMPQNNTNSSFLLSEHLNDKGVEVNLLNLIGEKLQLEMNYYSSLAANDWGEVYINGSLRGGLKMLFDQIDDIGIGSYMLTYERFLYTDSVIYHHDSLHWAVPFSLTNKKLENMLKVISLEVCIATLFVYLATVIGMLVFYKEQAEFKSYKTVLDCVLNSYLVLLGVAVARLPKSDRVRVVAALLILYSFFFLTAYQTFLTSILAEIQGEQELNNFDSILGSFLQIFVFRSHMKYFESNATKIAKVRERISEYRNIGMDGCFQRVVERKAAMTLTQSYFVYNKKNFRARSNKELVYMVKSGIVTFPIAIMMRKGFPLYDNFHKLILRVVSGGFIKKWQKDVDYFPHENVTVINDNSFDYEEGDGRAFSLDELDFIFKFWGIGCALALVCFVAENVHFRLLSK